MSCTTYTQIRWSAAASTWAHSKPTINTRRISCSNILRMSSKWRPTHTPTPLGTGARGDRGLRPARDSGSSTVLPTAGNPAGVREGLRRRGQTPVSIVGQGLLDFLPRVHHERPILDHGLA